MPRGVYDRSKMKKKTEAAPAAPKAPKGKRGRKPGSTNKVAAASPAKASGGGLELFATVRANIDTLTNVADKFGHGAIPAVGTEIAAHVQILSDLRKQVFGTGETKKAETAETKAETSNGTTATAAPVAATVPMPPAPIPSLPTATH